MNKENTSGNSSGPVRWSQVQKDIQKARKRIAPLIGGIFLPFNFIARYVRTRLGTANKRIVYKYKSARVPHDTVFERDGVCVWKCNEAEDHRSIGGEMC